MPDTPHSPDATDATAQDSQSLDAVFTELETIVTQLEEGSLSLEDAMTLFQRGVMLCRTGTAQLDQVETQIQQLLVKTEDGKGTLVPWEGDEEELKE